MWLCGLMLLMVGVNCGAVMGGKWLQWKWPDDWASIQIMVKELILSCAVWGPLTAQKRALFLYDNISVVILCQLTRDLPLIMNLLRSLWFFVACFDISIVAKHIAGVMNCEADQLSRSEFFCY